MGIKNTYRGIPAQELASYDFYDLTTGTGYKNFYGGELIEGSNSKIYVLSTNTWYGVLGYTSFTNVAGELNFDLDLEVPLTIDGVILVSAPIATPHTITTIELTFKIYSVDASAVETQLGSTVTITPPVAFNNTYYICSVKFEVDITRLKAGEKFRLSCANPNPGAGKAFYWLHDPKNRDLGIAGGTFVNSQLIVNLPIKI